MIKVLVVEDSAVIRDFLCQLLTSDPDISVVGEAANGEEALFLIKRKRPDVVTMDIHMPKMNGIEATRKIMEISPVPIVIVSGSTVREDVEMTFHAMEAGALTIAERPEGIHHPDHTKSAAEFIQTVKLMSEVKVIRRFPKKPVSASREHAAQKVRRSPAEIEVVAFGASTGGPLVLQTILSQLPRDLSASLLIVQHIADGFMEGFVSWLNHTAGFPTKIAADGERLLPGCAYVAPNGFHMGITTHGTIYLDQNEGTNGICPSIAHLFRSIASVMGEHAIGVLLTGMGADGASELKLMKDSGSVTIAQDKESSAIFGMPGTAIRLGAAHYILSPGEIAEALVRIINHSREVKKYGGE